MLSLTSSVAGVARRSRQIARDRARSRRDRVEIASRSQRARRDRAHVADRSRRDRGRSRPSPPRTTTWRRATPTGSRTATRAAPARRAEIAPRSRRKSMLIARDAPVSRGDHMRSRTDREEIARRSRGDRNRSRGVAECRKVSWKSSMSPFAIAMRQLLVTKLGQSFFGRLIWAWWAERCLHADVHMC